MRVTDLLRTMDIFSALPSEKLETIAQLLRERRLAESEVLCRQGDPGDAMFIVTGGRIRLSTTDPSGNEKVLTYFTDGQFFGGSPQDLAEARGATALPVRRPIAQNPGIDRAQDLQDQCQHLVASRTC